MSVVTLAPLSSLRRAKAPFADAVLICGKCVRKLGAEGKAIRKSLKRAAKRRPGGKLRLIETRCFSLCPKGRVVLASARVLGDHHLLVASPGLSPSDALDQLVDTCAFPAR
jgi:hypothetical protein